METDYSLRQLKEDYREIQEKHDLPTFKEINEDFGIEKLSDSESEILIREVRKFISEKFSNYLRFSETFLNPSNVQMFVYSSIKSLEDSDREKLKEVYNVLSKKEMEVIELDLDFSESKEAEYIKDSFKVWQYVKKELLKIILKIKKNWDNKVESKSKDYFG